MNDRILGACEISQEIISLIKNSHEYCFLITPFFKPWQLLARTLEAAASEKKNIVFMLGAENMDKPDLDYLSRDLGFDLVFIRGLHVKLYMNENTAIASSMNLYDGSRENTFELGYRTDRKQSIRELVETLIQKDLLGSRPERVLKGRFYDSIPRLYTLPAKKTFASKETDDGFDDRDLSQQKMSSNARGFCIHCHATIPQSVYRTLCEPCYRIWEKEHNAEHREKYCHLCGTEAGVTKNRALCYECYTNLEVW